MSLLRRWSCSSFTHWHTWQWRWRQWWQRPRPPINTWITLNKWPNTSKCIIQNYRVLQTAAEEPSSTVNVKMTVSNKVERKAINGGVMLVFLLDVVVWGKPRPWCRDQASQRSSTPSHLNEFGENLEETEKVKDIQFNINCRKDVKNNDRLKTEEHFSFLIASVENLSVV